VFQNNVYTTVLRTEEPMAEFLTLGISCYQS